ncbi:vanadium-dependent haloperoxidase [Cognaticolwellia mytili]|uniref:vanadium-dependent haloperoxidase n=1 Tax=Cognaticolwellia mytili TaxID=1888913 RepID=UPI000A16F225|nr:vanadium-dependent haloperoxidase [Cognaticolwellia mytili]
MNSTKNYYKKSIFTTTLTSLLLVACGGGSDSKPTVVPEPPIVEVILTPERSGYSVARQWNNVLLEAIRNDYARPTVHARNLFHISAAMYDSWAVFDTSSHHYLFSQTLNDYSCNAEGITIPADTLPEQERALSYASYRLLEHRFRLAPGVDTIMASANKLMTELGFDINEESQDYKQDGSAALGNYIANCYIEYGLQDGANERQFYANQYYQPVNPPLVLSNETAGNPDIVNLNRWQPLSIAGYIDQAGNPVDEAPSFLSPEWGNVKPFSLSENDKSIFLRSGNEYQVYHDPGMPPLIDNELSEEYKWGFATVAIWSAHLDQTDGVMWDISPKNLGNITSLPSSFEDYRQFYQQFSGGDTSTGYTVNPATNEPYQEQLVPRGDYGRVLAEFWADGPDSETPPGHWFVILNSVSDHPQLEKRWQGEGETLGNLEWDVKSYFAMGGTMHDAAISAWSIKGRYDYIRPVSAIRAMADLGQSSDLLLPSYHKNGITLVDNYIELVKQGDALAGANGENIDKIKLYSWKGPSYIDNPEVEQAGVGWILAENWWPYQRPSFVTPPFAGYVSGHSTYSRAAAELMTRMTGDAYFPGGMSEFKVTANEFLVFEQGPSVDMTLQWATYRDASDQCSLSRIWGGIHPPVDDIPGRLIGEKIGKNSFEFIQGFIE